MRSRSGGRKKEWMSKIVKVKFVGNEKSVEKESIGQVSGRAASCGCGEWWMTCSPIYRY
jgi:hypothetical protein